MNMPSDIQPTATTPEAETVPQSSTEEESRSSPPPPYRASPEAVDNTLASKQTTDSSTQTDTDTNAEQATGQSIPTDAALQQNPSVSVTLQPPNAAPAPHIPNAAPARARIPLSRPPSPEPNKACGSCLPATLVIICAFVVVMVLAFARDPNGSRIVDVTSWSEGWRLG